MNAGPDRPEEIDSGSRRKLLRLLGSLRETPAGSVIYRQVEGMLEDLSTQHLQTEMAYSGFVNVLLEAFVAHLTRGSSRYFQVRLLQARLQPPLTPTELTVLGSFVHEYAGRLQASGELDTGVLASAVHPLLAAFGIDSLPEDTAPAAETRFTPSPEARATTVPDADTLPEEGDAGTPGVEVMVSAEPAAVIAPLPEAEPEEEISEEIPAGQDLAAINRSELELRREEIAKLQATLGEQVIETISKNEEFGAILEKVLGELRQAADVADMENVRWTLIREVEKLMSGHHDLADQLDSTNHYLQLYESDSRQLTDELTRVRLLSLTDELTGLPNRRAFMRRLEDEVARVQRYGFPLSFVLIDLDHFKSVNDEHGHGAGDEVLRVYSKNILSIFRHHDMVARYGGEEFAVLLPNTDSDGTIRALNKVRRRAAETRWQTNGAAYTVPTFSAGVSLYKPGESVSAFIERADKALYRAKRLGRNRIELDMTYHKDSSLDEPRRRSTDQV